MSKNKTIILTFILTLIASNCLAGVAGTYVWKKWKASKELVVTPLDKNTIEISLSMGEGVAGGAEG